MKAHRAMNLHDALMLAMELRCEVRPVLGTGECDVVPPTGGKRLRFNVRKKDAPAKLVSLLRRLEKAGQR